jgi:hypothetical protein
MGHVKVLVACENPSMTDDSSDIERRHNDVVQTVVLPMRTRRFLDPSGIADPDGRGWDLARAECRAALIPRSLVGVSLFVFTAMLTAAEYACDPEPILDAAWQWEDLLRQAFGPDVRALVRPAAIET